MAKYAQNGLRMHLLQSRISKWSGGPPPNPPPTREGETLSRALPHLGLLRSVRASGTQLSLYFMN